MWRRQLPRLPTGHRHGEELRVLPYVEQAGRPRELLDGGLGEPLILHHFHRLRALPPQVTLGDDHVDCRRCERKALESSPLVATAFRCNFSNRLFDCCLTMFLEEGSSWMLSRALQGRQGGRR